MGQIRLIHPSSLTAIESTLVMWDTLFREKKHRLDDPLPAVSAFAESLLASARSANASDLTVPLTSACRILDLGCGAGRHTVLLAQMGLEVLGVDVSPRGLSATRDRFSPQLPHAVLCQACMTHLPYRNAEFDAVVSTYVIYHGTLELIQRAVAEIERVLLPGGGILLTLMSTRGYRFGTGVEIEPGTFLPDTGPDVRLPHHFFDRESASRLLSSFDQVKMELDESNEVKSDGQIMLHSHWLATGVKR
jgi:ubiquinone/menaquinone biosynthesis C-methylase UbiE